MRPASHVALGFFALIAIGAAWPIIAGNDAARPDVIAVAALYLGLTARDDLATSVGAALVLGYLADVLAGTPTGLLAFSSAAICFASHLAQQRLVVRGRLAVVIACAGAAVAMTLLVAALTRAAGIGRVAAGVDIVGLLAVAALTATLGALVFWLHRRVDARLSKVRGCP
jgi:rod shape-determining protein MreD